MNPNHNGIGAAVWPNCTCAQRRVAEPPQQGVRLLRRLPCRPGDTRRLGACRRRWHTTAWHSRSMTEALGSAGYESKPARVCEGSDFVDAFLEVR